VVARAQQAMPVIGWLSSASGGITAALLEFLQGLKETGFVEGQNVVIEYRLLRTNPICRRSQPISSAVV
jgi:putative ABC transport system substrate-binding protein